jgi:hypothetical protein
MGKNPENAANWPDGDVLVCFADEPTIPASVTVDFDETWEYVGVLNGDDGMPESVNSSRAVHTGWGVGVIVETEKDFELTRTFKARERNAVVHKLAYPGSDGEDVKIGPAAEAFVAFVTYKGDDEDRMITRRKCKVRRTGTKTVNEAALEEVEFTVTILPDEDGFHYRHQSTLPLDESGS